MSDQQENPVIIGDPSLTIKEPFSGGGTKDYEKSFQYFDSSFPLPSRYSLLHKQLSQLPFFRDLFDAFKEEIQTIIENITYPSAISFNSQYVGDLKKYEEDLKNVLSMLNYKPDYYLTPYLFSNLEVEIEWKKWNARSVFFSHRYRNSFYAYKFIFSRIWKHGGVFLEVYYPETSTTLTPLKDKAVRLVDNSTVIRHFLPPSDNWPAPGYITGAESYDAFSSLYTFKFDSSSRFFDEGVSYEGSIMPVPEEPDPQTDYYEYLVNKNSLLYFDKRIFPLIRDKTLILSDRKSVV
jgi:hypothetical protein